MGCYRNIGNSSWELEETRNKLTDIFAGEQISECQTSPLALRQAWGNIPRRKLSFEKPHEEEMPCRKEWSNIYGALSL